MLTAYINQTRRLLQNPSAPTALYSDADLTSWINIARGQLAGEAECIRRFCNLTTTPLTQVYNFSSLAHGTPAVTGVQGVIHVRSIRYDVGTTGHRWIAPRPWEWFELYVLNDPVPEPTYPKIWSQYGQGAEPDATGSSNGGSFYINVPDLVYLLNCDCVCYPIPLIDDTTVEAIPYLWIDAVPFFAAYYALLSAQSNVRVADAERYFNTYKMFVERARRAANPSVNRWMYQQGGDPAAGAKLQAQSGAG